MHLGRIPATTYKMWGADVSRALLMAAEWADVIGDQSGSHFLLVCATRVESGFKIPMTTTTALALAIAFGHFGDDGFGIRRAIEEIPPSRSEYHEELYDSFLERIV